MANPPDCVTVIAGMSSSSESTRKLAAFHLQSLVADASFADAFVQADGMAVLKDTIMEEQGNALAYALGSFTGLLEVDVGWEAVSPDIIERAVQLVISRPSINVLRNALFLLVLVVSRPIDQLRSSRPTTPSSVHSFGLSAVMPLLQMHEDFLDCLVERLGSADHALCVNALNLINALMRDSIVHGEDDEWPQLIVRLQELGVISAVESLMRGGALPDLVSPLLEFQGLNKVLLARWRGVAVDDAKYEHGAALQQLHFSSFRPDLPRSASSDKSQLNGADLDQAPHKWRRLGFQSEKPAREFGDAGFLGLMDLSEYVRRNIDTFQNTLLEQSILPPEQRCPVARASLSVTMLLYEYFDVESITNEDYSARLLSNMQGDNLERYIEPLLLHWERLHRAALTAFLKLWKDAGAVSRDYHKIEDLTRLLIGHVLGDHSRRGTTQEVEEQLVGACLGDVRKWQLVELEEAYDYAWGTDVEKLRQSIHTESVQFLKEQRIRCLLQGSWFPVISASLNDSQPSIDMQKPVVSSWRFVRLSHDRNYLHYASHPQRLGREPSTHELPHRIDLNTVSSVDSNVSRSPFPIDTELQASQKPVNGLSEKQTPPTQANTVTSLTLYGTSSSLGTPGQEKVLLELSSGSSSRASEWLDGLLMLLDQQPITADTNKLIDVLEGWSLKYRMINLRWEDVDWDRAQTREEKELPPRPTDRDYWYDMDD